MMPNPPDTFLSNQLIGQGFKISNDQSQKELAEFLMDRLKYYMKEKKIRNDIIEASISSYGIDHMNKIYKKSINKV